MSFDEPTQQIRRPEVSAPMPEPLDQTRPRAQERPTDSDSTGVLPLDELLGPPVTEEADATTAPTAPTEAEPAPTDVRSTPPRAPMPVVPVSSSSAPPDAEPTGRRATDRIRGDAAAAALRGGSQRLDAWLRRDDNALTVMTALVAILLLSVVAAVGS